MKRTVVICSALMLVLCMSGFSSAVTVNYEDGVSQTTTGLTGYSTYDQDMYGMGVAVTFGNGSTGNYVWQDLGGGASGISDSWGSLSFNGDSWSASWNLAGGSIDKIFLDAGSGDAVFDVWTGTAGTPNSANGRAFSVSSMIGNWDILATYSGIVAINGFAPVGDLYRYLEIDFVNADFVNGDTLSFRADTDSLKISGDIVPSPEPSTMLLLGAGLIGLAVARKKCKKL